MKNIKHLQKTRSDRARFSFYADTDGLHIAQGSERGARKTSAGRWGVLEATTGASPRNPQYAVLQRFHFGNPLQIRIYLKRDPRNCGKFA